MLRWSTKEQRSVSWHFTLSKEPACLSSKIQIFYAHSNIQNQ